MTVGFMYASVINDAFNGDLDYVAGTVQALLVDDTYTPNQDTHDRLSDITGELSGGSYARVTLSGKVLSYDAGTNTWTITASAITFAPMTGTFRYCILALNTGSAATSPLLFCVDYEVDKVATAQEVRVTIPTTGIAQVAIA